MIGEGGGVGVVKEETTKELCGGGGGTSKNNNNQLMSQQQQEENFMNFGIVNSSQSFLFSFCSDCVTVRSVYLYFCVSCLLLCLFLSCSQFFLLLLFHLLLLFFFLLSVAFVVDLPAIGLLLLLLFFVFSWFQLHIQRHRARTHKHTPTRKMPITKRREEEDSATQNIVCVYTPALTARPGPVSRCIIIIISYGVLCSL